jgi:DNA polymerase
MSLFDDHPHGAADFLPTDHRLPALRAAAAGCRGCDLYKDATQTVFGEGPAHARLLFVGEQPGDSEDREGRPFVGPAGKLLRESLAAAGIDENEAYITNAVKHFKFEWRGKRRIHATPKRIEVDACGAWLTAEIQAIKPALIVALGATAGQALLGPSFRVTKQRGMVLPSAYGRVVATIHPSAILRAPDDRRDDEVRQFIADLEIVAGFLADSR